MRGFSTLLPTSALQGPKVLVLVPIEVCTRATEITIGFVAPLLHPRPRLARGIVGYAVGMMEIPETGLRPSKCGPFSRVLLYSRVGMMEIPETGLRPQDQGCET
jgi:hypothetical protein